MTALTESQLSEAIGNLERDFTPFLNRRRVRRMLIERLPEMLATNDAGTNIPKPFDKSALLIRTVTGDVVDAVQHYAARISANPPQPIVPRISSTSRVAKKVDETAAEQERLLAALWDAADGKTKQYQVAWSQSWCGVGWYITMPREIGFGLPDRVYFDELTDEQLEQMRNADELSPEPLDDGRYAESAENWAKRRREQARKDAIDGKGLFTLEAVPGDMVRWRFDRDGLKYACVIEEVPASDFRAGSEYMKEMARRLGVSEGEADQFGVYMGADGKIVAGATQGGERDSSRTGNAFNFIRFFDRECVYYLVAGSGQVTGAKLLWHAYHGAGEVPCIPVPGIWTDSRAPGSEFSSPMESVFALAPLLNQVETLLSNVAAWNAIPRWYLKKPDGSLVVDEQGNPKEIAVGPTIGMDPQDMQMVEGELIQLTINADLLFKLLQVYAEQMQKAMPPDVAQGEGGTSGAAWTVRMLQSAAQADLEQPVGNHALGAKKIQRIWTRWMRLLDVPIYCLSVPRQRGNMRAVRGLIEFDPEDLTEGFEVVQSKNSQADMIVQQQVGLELYQKAQVIDAYTYFEEYAGAADPQMAVFNMYKEQLVKLVMGTSPTVAQPGSVLDSLFRAAQGRVFYELQRRYPNSAILTAQVLAEQAMMQGTGAGVPAGPEQNHELARGNVAEPQGVRQPGLGASVSLPGGPMSGLNAMEGRSQ